MLCLLYNLLSKHSKQSLVRVSCLVADKFQFCRANWNVNSSDFQYGPITACCIVQREVSSAYQKGMHYLRYQLGCHSCMVVMVAMVDTRRELWAISNADCWGRKGRACSPQLAGLFGASLREVWIVGSCCCWSSWSPFCLYRNFSVIEF